MPKTKISEFSATPGNNTDIDGINIAEGCAPSGINDAIRELMAQLKDFQTGAAGDSFNGPVGTTTAAAGAFTTLSASGAVTLSGGTANGVPYLNGSKVLTTGSALTFDGTNLTVPAEVYRTSASSYLRLAGGDAAAAGAFVLAFGQSHATAPGRLSLGTSGTGTMNFDINGSEQMRLTSTGLGIGTSSPAKTLHVSSGSYTYPARIQSTGGTTTGIELVNTGSSANPPTIGSKSDALFFETSNTERARIDSSGNLGLGVTPSAWASGDTILQVKAGSSSGFVWGRNGSLRFGANSYYDGTNNRYITSSTAAFSIANPDVGGFQWYIAPSGTAGNAISFTQAMTLDASGNLGVGTTSPTTRLSITDSTGPIVRLVRTSNRFELSADTDFMSLNARDASTYITFKTADTERARITSGGDLLVGTTSVTTGVSGTETTLTLQGNSSSKAASFVAVNNAGTGSGFLGVGTDNITYVFAKTNNALVLGTNNTERARIDSSGNLLVGITAASASSRLRLRSSGSTSSTVCAILENSAGTQLLYARDDGFFAIPSSYSNTTASAANVYIDANGFLYRSTSSLKYKTDVQDATHGLAEVMQLRPVTYKGKNDGDKVFGGLIAEEVHAAGLTEFVQYAEDGSPDALAYGNMVSLLTKAIQEQQAMIQELKAEFDAYKATHP
jgi:hypothetical protein